MKITHIIMENVKNQTKVQPLTGQDLFIGANGVGKTTRLQAIMGAILGYIPGKQKTIKSTFELSSGSKMVMGLDFDNGFSFRRCIKEESGKLSHTITIEGESIPTEREKQQRIKEVIGDFPVMFDFNSFLAMSDMQKRKFMVELAGGCGWTVEDVKRYLKAKLLTDELKSSDVELCELLDKEIDAITADIDCDDIDEAVNLMHSEAKERLAYYKKEVEMLSATVQKLTDIKNRLTITDRGLIEDKKALENLRNELILKEKELAVLTEKNKIAKATIDRIKVLQKEIEELKLKKPSESLEDIEKRIREEEKGIIPVDDIVNQTTDITKDIKLKNTELQELQEKLNKVQEQGMQYNAELNARVQLLNKIKDQKGKCAIDTRIPCKNDFSGFISSEEAAIKDLTKELEKARKEYVSINNNVQSKKKVIAELENQKDALTLKLHKIQQNNDQHRKNIIALQKKLNSIRAFVEVQSATLTAKEDEIAELKTKETEIIDTAALSNTISNIKDQIKRLTETIKAKEEAQRIMVQLTETQMELIKTEQLQAVYKQIVEGLGIKGVQWAIIEYALGPMIDDITKVLNLMGCNKQFKLITEQDNQQVFKFGWIDKERYVDFYSLSTGQQLLLMIAILVAFIEKAQPNLKILAIDNIENLDANNLKNVLIGLSKIKDKLDNIILSGVIDKSYTSIAEEAGFKVWDLSSDK